MKAKKLILSGEKQCILEEFDIPSKLDDNDVLVDVQASAISPGTEMSFYNKTHTRFQDPAYKFFPSVTGYAAVGRIILIGSKVKTLSVGDRVVTSGNHATHQIFPDFGCVKCPEGIPDNIAPFARIASIPMNGIRHACINMGAATVIMGQGLIGQLALCFAKLSGAFPVVAIDLSEKRLGISKKMGADFTLNPKKDNIQEAISDITKGRMIDRVVEVTTGTSAIHSAIEMLNKGGVLFLLGGGHGKVEFDLYSQVITKNLNIIGGHESGASKSSDDFHFPWTMLRNVELCLDLFKAGRIDISPILTHEVPFEDAPALYADISANPEGHLGNVMKYCSN